MKLFNVAAFCLTLSCLLPFARGEVDHYKMALEEKGTRFSEDIDVDGQKKVAVFRVPAHNNVRGADFYHDFNMRLTVSRILSKKVCYISKMDSSLPSPGKLKGDLDQAASQSGKLPVETKSHLVVVTGPANRLILTKEILDFCGILPIYNTEVYNSQSNGDGTAVIQSRRVKRQVPGRTQITRLLHFNQTCNSMGQWNNGKLDFSKLKKCINQGSTWDLACKFKDSSCFYFVTCEFISFPRKSWDCKEVHTSTAIPFCCDLVCRKKNG